MDTVSAISYSCSRSSSERSAKRGIWRNSSSIRAALTRVLACSAICWPGRQRLVSISLWAAGWMNRWQGQCCHHLSGFRKLSFCFSNVTLRLMQFGRRFKSSRQVGFHIVTAVVFESGVQVLLCTLEVAQLRVRLTKSLRDERDGIIVAHRVGVRQGTFHIVYRPGISTQEPGNSESCTHLVG